MGRPTKELAESYADVIRKNLGKLSISAIYDACVVKGLEMKFSTFRKFARSIDVREIHKAGKTPEEIVEILKAKGKHNRMTVESVRKMLEVEGVVEIVPVVKPSETRTEESYDNFESFFCEDFAGEELQVVEDKPSVPIEGVKDINQLVSKLVRWNKDETTSVIAITEHEIYKVILLSQMDDSILYIPYEILRLFKFQIEHILDSTTDMEKIIAISTIKVEGITLIVIAKVDRSNQITKIQIVKSRIPHKDRHYDLQSIKDNYSKINSLCDHSNL